MSAPVLITGAGGFVGGAVLERLLGAGLEVRALVRSPETAERVRRAGAQPVIGDILDVEGLATAMRGCELVFHVAGLNKMCLPDPAPLMRTNVDGSVSVVRAAARAGVRRIVYTSSAATLDSAPEPGGRTAGRAASSPSTSAPSTRPSARSWSSHPVSASS